MDVDREQENRPYEETLEAAKILEEVARSAGKKPSPRAKGKPASQTGALRAAKLPDESSEEGAQAGERTGGTEAGRALSPGQKEQPGGVRIGELFSNLVKMSPQEKIRVEEGSIGSLFKKYIGKRG
jgi:hypothetical protein